MAVGRFSGVCRKTGSSATARAEEFPVTAYELTAFRGEFFHEIWQTTDLLKSSPLS
jgi:hypothetical protein